MHRYCLLASPFMGLRDMGQPITCRWHELLCQPAPSSRPCFGKPDSMEVYRILRGCLIYTFFDRLPPILFCCRAVGCYSAGAQLVHSLVIAGTAATVRARPDERGNKPGRSLAISSVDENKTPKPPSPNFHLGADCETRDQSENALTMQVSSAKPQCKLLRLAGGAEGVV